MYPLFSVHFTLSINVWCDMIDDLLTGPVILDDRMAGQNYINFLQNELPKQLWLHGLLCTFRMTEPLLIIPDM